MGSLVIVHFIARWALFKDTPTGGGPTPRRGKSYANYDRAGDGVTGWSPAPNICRNPGEMLASHGARHDDVAIHRSTWLQRGDP